MTDPSAQVSDADQGGWLLSWPRGWFRCITRIEVHRLEGEAGLTQGLQRWSEALLAP